MTISDYIKGDAVSLAKIDPQAFTITEVVDSDFTKNGETKAGVKITTSQKFQIEGKEYNQFYTTRQTVVKVLRDPKFREALSNGKTETVKCVLTKGKNGGNDYYVLEDA